MHIDRAEHVVPYERSLRRRIGYPSLIKTDMYEKQYVAR